MAGKGGKETRSALGGRQGPARNQPRTQLPTQSEDPGVYSPSSSPANKKPPLGCPPMGSRRGQPPPAPPYISRLRPLALVVFTVAAQVWVLVAASTPASSLRRWENRLLYF